MTSPVFPFSDVVGQDDAKLALLLVTVDPRIGGVLLRGQKGTAKTTLARGLASLLGDAPFVELPLGATEDRLVGSLDAETALGGGGFQFRAGLLAEAHGGVLYVDEINLLADHLVDTLLDVSVSGENIVERDGVSHRHPARFILIGSMNPEEGELRPQLLDRFGFCVEMTSPTDFADRKEALRRRLAFDGHVLEQPLIEIPRTPDVFAQVVDRINTIQLAVTPDTLLESAVRLSVEVGAEGLRADLTLCRASAALAGLEGRSRADLDDLRRVAPLVLAHRSRRGPFDPPVMESGELDRALSQALGEPEPEPGESRSSSEPEGSESPSDAQLGRDGEPREPSTGSSAHDRPLSLASPRDAPTLASVHKNAERGRFVRDVGVGEGRPVSVPATARVLARRRLLDPSVTLRRDDLRAQEHSAPQRRTIVLCVDLSGSMGANQRAHAATGIVLGLLTDAYQHRDRVALVGFRGTGAQVLLTPTSSIEVARNRLEGLVTGGETPLASGIRCGLGIADASRADGSEPFLVLFTDGRVTGQSDGFDDAITAAAEVRRRGITSLVLDCETGPVRLNMAVRIASVMGARHVLTDELDPTLLTQHIRQHAFG